MTTHNAEMKMALHSLAHPRPKKVEEPTKLEPQKKFSVTQLHDGSFHFVVDHGDGASQEGSSDDLDIVHDVLEEEFGTPNEDEEHEEYSK